MLSAENALECFQLSFNPEGPRSFLAQNRSIVRLLSTRLKLKGINPDGWAKVQDGRIVWNRNVPLLARFYHDDWPVW